jgi:two-component system OmpR family sensor kinase/two-component system sensor histidine kinase BaeS
MGGPYRGRWRGGRPPWWPEGEPFPPRRRWGRRPPRFFFLVPLVLVAFFIALVAAIAWVGTTFGPWPVVAAIVILFLLGSRTFVTVGAMMDAIERVAEGDYEARVRAHGPRQLRALATSFNQMVERLRNNEAQRRQLLADVTHELRTPLTVIQGQLEGLLDGVYPRDDAHLEPILEETRVMSRVIDDLRILALAEGGALALHREPTDVHVLLEDALAPFRAQADVAGVALEVDAPASLPVLDVDPVRLRQVFGNLLANALRYTPRGGTIAVSARSDGAGRVEMRVRDTGAGVAPDALPHLFERFYKSADSRGSGLGLPIARSLVVAHGGEISASSDGAGRGLTIRFTLPASP